MVYSIKPVALLTITTNVYTRVSLCSCTLYSKWPEMFRILCDLKPKLPDIDITQTTTRHRYAYPLASPSLRYISLGLS